MISKIHEAELAVISSDISTEFDDSWVVLKLRISGDKAAVEFHDHGQREFAVDRLVQTPDSLDHLQLH